MIHTLFFLLYLLCSHVSLKVDGIQEDLELERQFDLINKPSMKSIHACLNFVMFHHMLPLVDITLHDLIIILFLYV